MAIKRIKQINNLVITLNEDNPIAYQYQVKIPDGRILEGVPTLELAEEFCRETTDFCIRGRKDDGD